MAQNETKCPVCFTKMNHIGHDLVCPECGYKYCEGRIPYEYDDHDHSQYETYNQKTSYTSTGTAPSSGSPRQVTSPVQKPAQNSYTRPSTAQNANATGRTPKKTSPAKIVLIFVCGYFIFWAVILIFGVVIHFLTNEDAADSLRNLFVSESSETTEKEKKSTKSKDPDDEEITATSDEETEDPTVEDPYAHVMDGRIGDSLATQDEYLAFLHTLDEPKTALQELLCQSTEKAIDAITIRDLDSITCIWIQDYDTFRISYDQNYSFADTYDASVTYFDSSELKFFTKLTSFRAIEDPNFRFQPGDIDQLVDLNYIECANTPEELASLVFDPLKVEALFLNSLDQNYDFQGLSQFANVQYMQITMEGMRHEEEIGTLQHMHSLSLYGPYHLEDYSFLGSLKSLEWLELRAPMLMDISFVEDLTSLQYLVILDNNYMWDLTPLQSRPELVELSLQNLYGLSDPTPIASLTNLEYLTLFDCNVRDVSWITSLTNLVDLCLAYNDITDVSPLAELRNLTSLELRGNPIEEYGDLDQSIIWDLEDLEE